MKLDRLIGILTVLLRNERVTSPYLAEKFEVTRRTIGRDIETLCQAGIPIVAYQGSGGGVSIAEGFKLDKQILTTHELSNIIAALKGLGSVSDKTRIERILEMLRASSSTVTSLHEPIVIDLASHYKDDLTVKIETIKQAILNNHIIEFVYFYEKGESSKRIEPYIVVFQWASWYVFGFCLERGDWRMFKLQRLWKLSVCDEQFSLRDIPPEKRDWGAILTDDKRLIALFDKSVKHLLIESYGLNCFREMDEGLYFEVGYSNQNYIIGWLLSFGDKVKVLEPADLSAEIQTIAKNIILRYL